MKRLGIALSIVASIQIVAVPALAQKPKPAPAAKDQDLIAKGQQQFEDQQYEESVQTLSAALLRPSNTKEQRVEIYRLLALNYITLNRTTEAENAVRGLLVQQPEYQLPPGESPRFRDFFSATQKKWEADGRPGLEDTTKPAPQKLVPFRHQPPSQSEPDKPIALRGHIEGASVVRLYYRTGSSGDFTDVEATLDEKGDVSVEIPASAVKPPIVEYYLVAQDPKSNVVGARGDLQTPLRIAVSEGGGKGWVLPVAIGGGVLGAAAIVGVLALAGVFKGSSGGGTSPPTPGTKSTVSVSIGEAGFRFH